MYLHMGRYPKQICCTHQRMEQDSDFVLIPPMQRSCSWCAGNHACRLLCRKFWTRYWPSHGDLNRRQAWLHLRCGYVSQLRGCSPGTATTTSNPARSVLLRHVLIILSTPGVQHQALRDQCCLGMPRSIHSQPFHFRIVKAVRHKPREISAAQACPIHFQSFDSWVLAWDRTSGLRRSARHRHFQFTLDNHILMSLQELHHRAGQPWQNPRG